MVILGFTGSRQGMTASQKDELRALLRMSKIGTADAKVGVFHYGGAVGADAEAYEILRICLGSKVTVVCHPCTLHEQQDFPRKGGIDLLMPELPPLERNRKIVDACRVLLAAPHGPEELRSGTWSTIRYARKIGRRVVQLKREDEK